LVGTIGFDGEIPVIDIEVFDETVDLFEQTVFDLDHDCDDIVSPPANPPTPTPMPTASPSPSPACPTEGRVLEQVADLAPGASSLALPIDLHPCERMTLTITAKRSRDWSGAIGYVTLQNFRGAAYDDPLTILASGSSGVGPDEKSASLSELGRTYRERALHQVVVSVDPQFGNLEYYLRVVITPRPGYNDAGLSAVTARPLEPPISVRGNVLGGQDPGNFYSVFVRAGEFVPLTVVFGHQGYGSQNAILDLYDGQGALIDDGFVVVTLAYDETKVRTRQIRNTTGTDRWYTLRVHGDESFGAMYREVLYALCFDESECPLHPPAGLASGG
jgi:hypothetical protein